MFLSESVGGHHEARERVNQPGETRRSQVRIDFEVRGGADFPRLQGQAPNFPRTHAPDGPAQLGESECYDTRTIR